MPLQDRTMLLIDENTNLVEAKSILKSPLGLAKEIISRCYSNNYEGLRKFEEKLDSVKSVAAGINRARTCSEGYKIANYSKYLFAFHQFFQSSYRARQGYVLDTIIYRSLEAAQAGPIENKKEAKEQIKNLFGIRHTITADVDFCAIKQDGSILIGQTRSTDVTGGTTAKASLVSLLHIILDDKNRSPPARYVVLVWEPLARAQRTNLVNSIWDVLKPFVRPENETDFKEQIENGWEIRDSNITFKLVYGIENLGNELNLFAGGTVAKEKLMSLWNSIQYDDLWLAYAVASIELDNLIFNGKSNFQVLDEKLRELDINISVDDLINYKQRSQEIADELRTSWNTNLPVTTPSDISNYLRDLVLLKMVFTKTNPPKV